MKDRTTNFIQRVERAVFDLCRGLPVVVRDGEDVFLAASVEGISAELYAELYGLSGNAVRLTLNAHRLAHLGVALADGAPAASLLLVASDTRDEVVRWAADPSARWPRERRAEAATRVARASLALVHRGALIPAALVARVNACGQTVVESRVASGEWLAVNVAEALSHCTAAPTLQRISEASVPLAATPHSRFVVFRERDVAREHVAILIGEPGKWPAPVPVRAHSSCLTGDLFGSLRCDCGSQLRRSVETIQARGGGVLLYLSQEGRNIGLANKMRAYQLQDDGFDTVDADHALGFDGDERHYAVAREMLSELGVTNIDLLTNNPVKLAGMDRPPIHVANRSAIFGELTDQNRRYLRTKAVRGGHWLDELLAEPAEAGSACDHVGHR